MSDAEFRLKIAGLTKSYGIVKVLNGVTLNLKAGEIAGIIGENGAGKSTLVKCILNLVDYQGIIERNGHITAIHQEFNLVKDLTVAENIFLGCEPLHGGVMLNQSEMRRRTRQEFERLGVNINPNALISDLSLSERQMVEVAKAMAAKSNVLIMDEPTTLLNRAETEVLFKIMRDYAAAGNSILFISHKLAEVKEICDTVAVLRDGELVSTDAAENLTPLEMAKRMVGRNITTMFPDKLPDKNTDCVLKAEHLSSGKKVVDASFELHKGEILGIAGLAGSGRSELAEAICAFRKISTGKLFLYGKPCRFRTPAQALKAGISYLTEDRQESGILRDFTISENISLASWRNYVKWNGINFKNIAAAAKQYIADFRIKCTGANALLSSLSGGNQQKVALAKGLDSHPKIFIFDEPTRGVDIAARRDIYEFIHQQAANGVACLMICSDLEELLGMCSKVMVMREGATAGFVGGEQLNEEEIMYLATGVK